TGLVCGLLLGLGSWSEHAAATDSDPDGKPVWLDVEINGVGQESPTIAIVSGDRRVWVVCRSLLEWHFVVPANMATHEYLGRNYCPLDAAFHPGQVQWNIDTLRQVLVFNAAATAMQATSVAIAPREQRKSPVDPGAYLNYDLNAQRIDGEELDNGLLELGVF